MRRKAETIDVDVRVTGDIEVVFGMCWEHEGQWNAVAGVDLRRRNFQRVLEGGEIDERKVLSWTYDEMNPWGAIFGVLSEALSSVVSSRLSESGVW